MLSRNSNTRGFSEEDTRTQPGFAPPWTSLEEVTYRAILCHYKNTPHPAPHCVWVGGQVWFHLLRNTAHYHSTEHKQLFICTTAQLKSVTAVTASLAPAHGVYLIACLQPQTNHLQNRIHLSIQTETTSLGAVIEYRSNLNIWARMRYRRRNQGQSAPLVMITTTQTHPVTYWYIDWCVGGCYQSKWTTHVDMNWINAARRC